MYTIIIIPCHTHPSSAFILPFAPTLLRRSFFLTVSFWLVSALSRCDLHSVQLLYTTACLFSRYPNIYSGYTREPALK